MTRGQYRLVRWEEVRALGGERLIRVIDALGLGLAHHYLSVAAFEAAVDAAYERDPCP